VITWRSHSASKHDVRLSGALHPGCRYLATTVNIRATNRLLVATGDPVRYPVYRKQEHTRDGICEAVGISKPMLYADVKENG
jgi:hypothetical protein